MTLRDPENVQRATEDMGTSRWWTLAEVVVAVVLVASWSAAYIRIADEIKALPDFRRAPTLELYLTDSRIWLGYALGLASFALLLLQRFAPFKAFVVSAALAAATGWWFSYLETESFAIGAVVVVGAFWAARASRRWKTVLAVALGSIVIGNVRAYQVNDRLEALGGDTSGWVGPTTRIAVLAVLVGVSMGATYLVPASD